jgi:glycosyltransferase involved in cell wall biosynthesis
MLISVVIRTYNEAKYLDELLAATRAQVCSSCEIEVVLVDSGSTDDTLEIAGRHGCRITHISQEEFSFGRSLNLGCEFARGDYLAFVSGHCIPENEHWLDNLVQPLRSGEAAYTYGRQRGRDTTRFSEQQHFDKAFPDYSKIPQDGYFCNNANAAIRRDAWEQFRFDEELTGLEDMHLAKRLTESGMKTAYVADASVFHIHDESWRQVRTRYEREAYALHQIMPQLHFTLRDFLRFFVSGVLADSAAALRAKRLLREIPGIFMFRLMHYWGTYRGNHEVRQLSAEMKHRYFYPKDIERHMYEQKSTGEGEGRRPARP